jgi:glycosyltransferase involved in cell wall biosynthesis
MKVAINALFLRTKVAGGTETYVTNIVRRWYEAPLSDTEFLLLANHTPEWWEGDRPWFRLRQVDEATSLARRVIYEQVAVAWESRNWDVLFCPGYVGVLKARCPQVITVHDAYAWVLPKEAGRFRTLYWRFMILRSVRKAEAVIAVSESTRKDIVRYTAVDLAKVRVVLEAGDHFPETEMEAGPDPKVGEPPYFLSVGFFKSVKNPERTLSAYSEYRRTRLAQGKPACRLKLVGAVLGREAEELQARAAGIDGVDILGRVDDARLRRLLAGAYGFLFASLYEGFGIPILEAQRAGCPVVTSDTSSMPEVAGEGALLVDPLDKASLVQAMIQLHQPGIRAGLIESGRRNSARFSWRRASEETLALIREIARVGSTP